LEEEIGFYGRVAEYLLVDYPYDTIDYYLDQILRDMIAGSDLSIYDNRYGRCHVTFKPLSSSPNGRLKEPGDEPWYDVFPNIADMDQDSLNYKPFLFEGLFG